MRVGAWVSLGMAALLLAAPAAASAQVVLPAHDLHAFLALTGVDSPAPVPVQHNPEPPLVPVPRASCGPGSHPLDGMQGRVPKSAAGHSWTCNVAEVSHVGGAGGFKVWRYVDRSGR